LVSGSLLKGSVKNKILLEYKSEYLGNILTEPIFTMYNLGYTCILGKGSSAIHCEVYKITQNAVLQNLLKYICGGQAKLIETEFGNAFIFWQPDFVGAKEQLIESGDYRKRKFIRKSHKLDTKCKLEAEY